MDSSTKYIGENNTFLGFNSHKNIEMGLVANFIKHSLLVGAEKLMMARNPQILAFSDDFASKVQSKREGGKHRHYEIQSTHSSLNHHHNYNLKTHNHFPLNLISFFPSLIFKLATFQLSLFLSFFTFPIWCLNLSLMLIFFPYQTLNQIRDHMKQKLLKSFNTCCYSLISIISNRVKSQKSILRLAVRSTKALVCAIYVFFVLVGMLVLGFAVSGFMMRFLVEESIHTRETLNFDYTKTSPVAVVPVASISIVNGGSSSKGGAIPYNQKLQITVSLTMPESEYNRKLGIFQVRVERLSSNGNVILGSSYPTMLRFKSQPVRVMETVLNTVPLITGMKSEVQNLKIVMGEFTEGHEATTFFKVVLEQRAEFQAGSGVPEIYDGSLEIASELPRMKMIISSWKRTIFVWISFAVFFVEMILLLIFYRPVVLLGGLSKGGKKKSWHDKISWYKT